MKIGTPVAQITVMFPKTSQQRGCADMSNLWNVKSVPVRFIYLFWFKHQIPSKAISRSFSWGASVDNSLRLRDFGPLSSSPVPFLSSSAETCLCVAWCQEGDACASFLETLLDALTPAWVLFLTVLLRLQNSLLLVHLFLPRRPPPLNVYTLRYSSRFSTDLLLLAFLVEAVDHPLDSQVSGLLHECGCVYWTRPRDVEYL